MTETAGDTTFTFTDPDGFEIFVRQWAPTADVQPKAVVQIAHGAAEHSLRYERFAKFLNTAGYLVYANDHRGHWRTAGTLERAGIAGDDGWNGMVRDAKQLTDIIKQKNRGLPVFLFGHSMGSMLGQQYIQQWGDGLKGAVLCGTSGARPDLDAAIARAEAEPRDKPSSTFGLRRPTSNQASGTRETGYEWLTRDEAEVQKYIDDPWCGFTFSNGLVLDLLKARREVWRPENEARVPQELPISLISGDQDQGARTIPGLADRYRGHGLNDVTYKLYPGARHELLNETNRDEVQEDLLNWFDSHLA